MAFVNEHYLKLKAGYLFPEIGRRVKAFAEAHPDAKIIRMGIGDVTEPLPPAVIAAMHKAVDEMDVKQESAPEMYGAAKVYVTRGGDKYYHTKDCPTLKGIIAMPRPLSEVKEMYSPCPQCNPPQ